MALMGSNQIDTVIIGGGPASLILSYILHGYIPYYKGGHHDPLLDSKLRKLPSLLHISPDLASHFGSSIRYSSQALPINALLDTLVRPNADTEIDPPSCVEWRFEPSRAVPHVVLTEQSMPGGQWFQNPGSAGDKIGTLSYAEMLSLPGVSFGQHYEQKYGSPLPPLMRPTRAQVAAYYAEWPSAVGISASIQTSSPVTRVSRAATGFYLEPVGLSCRNVVLGTGIFSLPIPPPRPLAPIQQDATDELPLLVIGSGFSAADAIISASPTRKIIHLFKWRPDSRPSPLRACHHQAYPEYAGVYRQMKASAAKYSRAQPVFSPFAPKRKNPFFASRDWETIYEGYPNANVEVIQKDGKGTRVQISLEDGTRVEVTVGDLAYHIGRRGSLGFLNRPLRREVVPHIKDDIIASQSLRAKAEISTELAPDVFIVGSLTGDSLVRHAFGACVYAASRIMQIQRQSPRLHETWYGASTIGSESNVIGVVKPRLDLANGEGHADLHIDRRKLTRMDDFSRIELVSPLTSEKLPR